MRVEKFRKVVKPAELSFADGVNVLLGQNGTGKTTLLEMISMVMRSDFSSLAKEEFALEYELSAGEGESLIVAIRNERAPGVKLQAPFDLGAREAFRPSAEVLGGADRRSLVQVDPEHGLRGAAVQSQSPVEFPFDLEPKTLVALLLTAAMGLGRDIFRGVREASTPHRFDESLDMFHWMTRADDLGQFFTGGSSSSSRWVTESTDRPLIPDLLLQKVAASLEENKSDYVFADEELGFLATLKELMGFSSAELRLSVTGRSPDFLQLGNLLFRFRWGDGTFITHERLSYGQKRLVTFFYYLACNPSMVIADELVNGLHHRWITASIEVLGERQAFLTSQNPLLFDYVPITSAEQARRSFVLCHEVPSDGRPGWAWENMSDEDAGKLFGAYEVGIEHVSEILQSRGLW